MRKIHYKELRKAILAAADAQPDKMNPTGHHGLCLYTDTHDPDNHCLVGQALCNLQVELPNPMSELNGKAFATALINGGFGEVEFTQKAIELAQATQSNADMMFSTWKEATDILRETV